MANFDWKKLLGTVAPWLATTLGGPLAGTAVKAITSALGLPGDSTEDQISAALVNATPEQLLALKAADNQHAEVMQKLGFDHIEKLAALEEQQVEVVNKTIQTEIQESSKEAWYQKAWRPANGFCVASGSFLGVAAICYLFYAALVQKDQNALVIIPTLATAIATILAVPGAAVGIAAWHRGVEKVELAKASAAGGQQ